MDKMKDKFEDLMDQNYEVFCMGKLAELHLDLRRYAREVYRAKEGLKEAKRAIKRFDKDSHIGDYHASRHTASSGKSQHVRDLERIKDNAKA